MALHCILLLYISLPYITLHHILRAWCWCKLHNTHHLHRHDIIINISAFILHAECQRCIQCLLSSWAELGGGSMRCRSITLCWQRKADHGPPLAAVSNCPARSAMTASYYEVVFPSIIFPWQCISPLSKHKLHPKKNNDSNDYNCGHCSCLRTTIYANAQLPHTLWLQLRPQPTSIFGNAQ